MATITITLPIEPGRLASNKRLVPQYDRSRRPTGRLINSDTYRAALYEASLAVRQACILAGWRMRTTPVVVDVTTYCGKRRLDRDSTCKGAQDALAAGLAIENDDMVNDGRVRRVLNDPNPRIVVTVTDEETL